MSTRSIKRRNRGVALLMVVVVISAAALIMALGSAILGVGEADSGYTASRGGEAFSLADGCMEEALEHLRIDNAYTGGSITATDGSCTITISGGGMSRTITVFGSTTDLYNKKIQAAVTLTPANRSLVINSWQELSS
ncbi:MAG: hypothetical protein AAB783_01300 [Patescibacteria group bacterium]